MATPSVVDLQRQAPDRSQWWQLVLVLGPVTVSAVLTLFAAAYPGGNYLLALFAIPAWLLSGLIWISLLMTRGSSYRRSPWIIATPLIGALTLALANSQLPMRAAFLISEPALTSYAQSLPEQERSSFRQERVGLFTVDTAQRWKGVTHLGVASAGGMLIKCGFAYVPDGRVEDLGVSSFDHVTGDWYATCTDYD
ncbi:hypothetical protein [Streptosporangium amethystogenes]|uniref:hypothetical protein n=1 Tax=Streptosporangium amethystogenes TaxID=2002 RepID=UPI0012FBA0E3|nr:hypothetical protein [Streptosporangium amethystogenes]